MSRHNLFKAFLKKFDYFGVQFQFKYHSKEKYQSATGGFIFIGFILLSVIYIGINLPPFVTRKNVSVVYYTTQLSHTDTISLANFSSTVAFGLNCGGLPNKSQIFDFLSFEFYYINQQNNEGELKREKIPIELGLCNQESFYNNFVEMFKKIGITNFNESFEKLDFGKLYCPKEINHTITGVYSDPDFQYYELVLKDKTTTKKDQETLFKILTMTECLQSTYFIDVGFDIKNYNNPTKYFLNQQFTALKPAYVMKTNIFFKLYSFDSYEDLILNGYKNKFFVGNGGIQEYSVYKGLDRYENTPTDYNYYSKTYFRADGSRTFIQRKYMKLNEFAANMASLISQVFIFLIITVSHMNSFFANKSLLRRIFIYKEGYITSKVGIEMMQEIKAFLSHNRKSEFSSLKEINNQKNHSNSSKVIKSQISSMESGEIENSGFATSNLDRNDQSKANFNHIFPKENNFLTHWQSRIPSNLKSFKPRKNENPFFFGVFEIIAAFLFPCFLWPRVKKKINYFSKCHDIVCNRLEIMNYLKHIQIVEILANVIFEKNCKNILYFLAKPSISFANFIQDFNDKMPRFSLISSGEFTEFYSSFQQIAKKQVKTELEKRLFHLSEAEFKKLFSHDYCIKK